MLRFLLALMAVALPLATYAAPAPSGCADHFVAGELPVVNTNRSPKTHLLCFSEYAVLYSGLSKTPIWSAEHLTTERIEMAAGVKRRNSFHPENRLPPDERSELSDYQDSGFDRGHMSPSGDMPDAKSQRESFSLANMIPQDPCSNEEQWEGIESSVRKLAADDDEVFVVTGPIYPKGAPLQQIGDGVLVPPQIFKAIYIPSKDAASAYIAPNSAAKEFKSVSIDDLTKLVDVDVFPKLAPRVKATVIMLPPPQPPKFRCRLHEND